jgi:hypothetical protein
VEDLFGDFTDKYHSEIEKSKQFNTYHTYLSTLRVCVFNLFKSDIVFSKKVELHMIFKSVLTNANSREQTLSYIAKVVECNKKLSQLHVNHDELASSPAMLQLASVLLDLSCKVQIDKVQEDYIFHPNARVNVKVWDLCD